MKPKCFAVFIALTAIIATASASVRLSEFQVRNDGDYSHNGDEFPQWVEIHNDSPDPAALETYHLRLSVDSDITITLPAVSIAPGQYIVVPLANTPLKSEGYLALVDANEQVLTEFSQYPKQRDGISYGLAPTNRPQYFLNPSPGEQNSSGLDGFVEDTRFSTNGGFFKSPIEVTISTATANSTILYTLDGSQPGIFNPSTKPYNAPIRIDRTTVIRAYAQRAGYRSTNIDTQSYLFFEDIINQPKQPQGFPESWGNGPGIAASMPAKADYAMDPRITEKIYSDMNGESFGMEEALLSIPSFSVVMNVDQLWNPETGLHALAQNKGRDWERPISLEYFDAGGKRVTQVNAGIRMQGGWNRNPEMLKKSLRLYFRQEYGDKHFTAKLFPGTSVSTFDTLVLRSGNGKAWPSPWRPLSGTDNNSLEQTTYLRDEFARVAQRDMGHLTANGAFAHLYINGLYWGLYNVVERPDAHFAQTYLSGGKNAQDVIKWIRSLGRQIVAGNSDAWDETLRRARTDVSDFDSYREAEAMVDTVSLVDYMLLNFYIGNTDWPDNNAYALRPRVEDGKWQFLCWDSEESLVSNQVNQLNINQSGNASELYQRLRKSPEFTQLIIDRSYKHLAESTGVLSDRASVARLMNLASIIDRAIIGESARWGDLMRPNKPYDREDWLNELANLRDHFFGENDGFSRSQSTIEQLKAAGLWTNIEPPLINIHDGNFSISKRTIFSRGTVYYTSDGSDPRLPGGAINPNAKQGPASEPHTHTITITARAKFGNDWSAPTNATYFFGEPATSKDLRISEIMYHPKDDVGGEFIALQHFGTTHPINLNGITFRKGVHFELKQDYFLKPGETVYLVQDKEAFEQTYGFNLTVLGTFEDATKLANQGESIQMVNAREELIQSLTYDDAEPWPLEADGQGAHLVLAKRNGDPSDPSSWKAIFGPPISPISQPDQDILEQILIEWPSIIHVPSGYWQVNFIAKSAQTEFDFTIETSENLFVWQALDEKPKLTSRSEDKASYQAALPATQKPLYFRLRVIKQ